MAETENVNHQLDEEQVRRSGQLTVAKLEEEIHRGEHTGVFIVLLFIAAFKDFGQIITTASVVGIVLQLMPIGWIVNGIFSFLLWFIMKQNGWLEAQKEVKRKIQAVLWGLGFFADNLPAVQALPLTTITVFYIRKQTKKRAAAAKIELEELLYTMNQEMERVREEEEIQIEEIEQVEEDESISPQNAGGQPTQKSYRIEGTGTEEGTSSETKGTPPKAGETAEEMAIPEEVRDPLGKLKREYFETPPDESLSQGPSIAPRSPGKVIPFRKPPTKNDSDRNDQSQKLAA